MKKDDFTVDQVEGALRWIFGDKSKKEGGLMDKSQAIPVNSVRVKSGVKRKTGGNEGRICFYCLQGGHFKSTCPIMLADRDPKRVGGPLFRTDINTAPGAKKVKKAQGTPINTIKVVVSEGEKHLNEAGKTLLEVCAEDEALDDIESLDPNYHEGFEGGEGYAHTPIESPLSMEGIEEAIRRQHAIYLRILKGYI
ncbi:hypothetical protein P3T76_001961 [Phytophthora citrophthora]|uniref:CCHC-type domain-containing protein n=1 Tax=Phytophthora citrophthora TaxID=4793 RepID=A0AAD9GYB1_9STRA|nr:hypothetical protein P3T76_001961 [Phytophthora citrophthora]